MVKRFLCGETGMFQVEHGSWVHASDYDALAAQLAAAEREKSLAEQNEGAMKRRLDEVLADLAALREAAARERDALREAAAKVTCATCRGTGRYAFGTNLRCDDCADLRALLNPPDSQQSGQARD